MCGLAFGHVWLREGKGSAVTAYGDMLINDIVFLLILAVVSLVVNVVTKDKNDKGEE